MDVTGVPLLLWIREPLGVTKGSEAGFSEAVHVRPVKHSQSGCIVMFRCHTGT